MNPRQSKELLAFAEDHVWVNRHMEVLIDRYAEQWIAVKNGQIIASAPDLTKLLSNLPDPAHTCVEFITREPLEMVL